MTEYTLMLPYSPLYLHGRHFINTILHYECLELSETLYTITNAVLQYRNNNLRS